MVTYPITAYGYDMDGLRLSSKNQVQNVGTDYRQINRCLHRHYADRIYT